MINLGKIWRDPVGSKLIAGGISSFIGALGYVTWQYVNNDSSDQVTSFFNKFFLSNISVGYWVLILYCFVLLFTFLHLSHKVKYYKEIYLKSNSVILKQQNETEELKAKNTKQQNIISSFEMLVDSSNIINYLTKNEVQTTTVKDFVKDTDEDKLDSGSIITIVTNDLESYDLLPEYISVLSKNLQNGVTYNYYLPESDEAFCISQANELKARIINLVGIEKAISMFNHLNIFVVEMNVIYSLAIVKNHNSSNCYWYFAFEKDNKGDNLCIVNLKNSTSTALKKIIAKIESDKSKKKVDYSINGGSPWHGTH